MPNISCLCGHTIDLSPVPNDDGYRLYWEPKLEAITEQLASVFEGKAASKEFERELHWALFRTPPVPPQIYECDQCGRLVVFAHPSDEMPAFWYAPEKITNEGPKRLKNIVYDG
jgi:hypothetical protein